MIRAVVTDIEGTTGSIAFVHEVLFPYARRHLADFLREHGNEPAVAGQLAAAREEAGEPGAELERVIAILEGWIDADRKVTPLKALQGMIWEQGYREGDFTGHIYPDAVAGLKRWQQAGIELYVYSSGAVQAQKLLFGHSDAGDLTSLFSGFFDTAIGHKREPASYRHISQAIDAPPEAIMFLSDVVEELDAAAQAGLRTIQIVRDPDISTGAHPVAADFSAVRLNCGGAAQ